MIFQVFRFLDKICKISYFKSIFADRKRKLPESEARWFLYNSIILRLYILRMVGFKNVFFNSKFSNKYSSFITKKLKKNQFLNPWLRPQWFQYKFLLFCLSNIHFLKKYILAKMRYLDSRVLVETKSRLCVRRRKSDVKKSTPDLKQNIRNLKFLTSKMQNEKCTFEENK